MPELPDGTVRARRPARAAAQAPRGSGKPVAYTVGAERSAALRLEIDGEWLARDFKDLMGDFERAYTRLGCLLFVATPEGQQYVRHHPYTFADSSNAYWPPSSHLFRDLVAYARRRQFELRVGSIEYASPGWVEVIGAWNPLKIIADYIATHRHENTERERVRLEQELALQKVEADQRRSENEKTVALERIRSRERVKLEKLRSKERTEIFRQLMPPRSRALSAEVRERLIEYLAYAPMDSVSDWSEDSRIGVVKIHELDTGEGAGSTD